MSPLRIVSLLIIILGTVEISPDCAARINFLTGRNYPSGEYPIAAVVQDSTMEFRISPAPMVTTKISAFSWVTQMALSARPIPFRLARARPKSQAPI